MDRIRSRQIAELCAAAAARYLQKLLMTHRFDRLDCLRAIDSVNILPISCDADTSFSLQFLVVAHLVNGCIYKQRRSGMAFLHFVSSGEPDIDCFRRSLKTFLSLNSIRHIERIRRVIFCDDALYKLSFTFAFFRGKRVSHPSGFS